MKQLVFSFAAAAVAALLPALCSCESWCDRNKPVPVTPLTEIPKNAPPAYSIRTAVELMAQRLTFYFSSQSGVGAPLVYLVDRDVASFRLFASLAESKVIRPGSSNAEFRIHSARSGTLWRISVTRNGQEVFSRKLTLKTGDGV